jgi:hypothetical protein
MKRLIGVAGKARSGKDEFTRGLMAQGYTRGAFADALKQVTALIADEPLVNFTDDVLKEGYSPSLKMTRRAALQKVGAGGREILHDGVWVERLLAQAAQHDQFAISDVRYPNEAQAIRALGGIVVLIDRPDNVGLTGEAAAHSSEQPLPGELVSVYILNQGNIGQLHAEAKLIAEWLELRTP